MKEHFCIKEYCLTCLTAERDRLKARVTELETQLAEWGGTGQWEHAANTQREPINGALPETTDGNVLR